MARFSGQSLPAATYNPALNTAGQSIAAGVSQAGQALGAGIESYIKNKVQKREDERAVKHTAKIMWDSGMAQRMGVESLEELEKFTNVKDFAPLLQAYEMQKQEEDRDNQQKVTELKLKELYRNQDKSTLHSLGFGSGQQVRDYINQPIDSPEGLPSPEFIQNYIQENPLTARLQDAANQGATDDQLLQMYKSMTGRGGLTFGQSTLPDGSKVSTSYNPATGETSVLSDSQTQRNFGNQTIFDNDGNPIATQTMTASGATGPMLYNHSDAPGTPLDQVNTARAKAGTQDDDVRSVLIRKLIGDPTRLSASELQKNLKEAEQLALSQKQDFNKGIKDALNDDTIKYYSTILAKAGQAKAAIEFAKSNGSQFGRNSALKIAIQMVEAGVVRPDEFRTFTNRGIIQNLATSFANFRGNVSVDEMNEVEGAVNAMLNDVNPKLKSIIDGKIEAQKEIYNDIPQQQQDKLYSITVGGFIDQEIAKSQPELQLPGVSIVDGKTMITDSNGTSADLMFVVHELAKQDPSSAFGTIEYIRDSLTKRFAPDLVEHIISQIEESRRQKQGQ